MVPTKKESGARRRTGFSPAMSSREDLLTFFKLTCSYIYIFPIPVRIDTYVYLFPIPVPQTSPLFDHTHHHSFTIMPPMQLPPIQSLGNFTKTELVRWSEDCFYYCSERNNVVVLFGTLKVQSFVLTEVSDCGLLIVVTSSTFLKRKDMLKEKSS